MRVHVRFFPLRTPQTPPTGHLPKKTTPNFRRERVRTSAAAVVSRSALCRPGRGRSRRAPKKRTEKETRRRHHDEHRSDGYDVPTQENIEETSSKRQDFPERQHDEGPKGGTRLSPDVSVPIRMPDRDGSERRRGRADSPDTLSDMAPARPNGAGCRRPCDRRRRPPFR